MKSRSTLIALLFALPLVAQEAAIKWHFTADEGWGHDDRNALTTAGWAVNSYAARPLGLKVVNSPAYPSQGALEMWDCPDGIPEALLSFKPLAGGELVALLGVQGKASQYARLELLADDTLLASIVLRDTNIGMFSSGAETKGFKDTESWYRSPRRFRLAWSGAAADKAGTVSFTFEPKGQGAEVVSVKDVAFKAPGIPNRMRLRVGDHAGSGKGLILDQLIIQPPAAVPTPAAAPAPEPAPVTAPAPAKAGE